jgi:hypothetical protein
MQDEKFGPVKVCQADGIGKRYPGILGQVGGIQHSVYIYLGQFHIQSLLIL